MGDGEAMERTEKLILSRRFVGPKRCLPGLINHKGDNGIHLGIHLFDLAEMGFEEFPCAQILLAQTAREFGGGEETEFFALDLGLRGGGEK